MNWLEYQSSQTSTKGIHCKILTIITYRNIFLNYIIYYYQRLGSSKFANVHILIETFNQAFNSLKVKPKNNVINL